MNKFRKLGLIEYNGGLKVNSSLTEYRPSRLIDRHKSHDCHGLDARQVLAATDATGPVQAGHRAIRNSGPCCR